MIKQMLAVSAVSMYAFAGFAADKAPLDGKTFEIQMTDPQRKTDKDTLTFGGGQLDALGCHQYGFGKGPYQTNKSGDSWTFTSTVTSPKEGTNNWSGKVTGDKIEGKLVWTKAGQAPITYTYSGALKK